MNESNGGKIDPELLAHYRASVVTVIDHDRMVKATELSALLDTPVFVVTAWNPRSRRLSRTENDTLDRRLQELLESRGIVHWRSRSCDQLSEWCEDGYALFGLSADDALDLARTFHQYAIFQVTGSGIDVIVCS